jgi:hypothetical protein
MAATGDGLTSKENEAVLVWLLKLSAGAAADCLATNGFRFGSGADLSARLLIWHARPGVNKPPPSR